MVAGTVLLCVPLSFSGTAATVIGSVICAMGGAFALIRWLQLYICLPVKTAVGVLSVAYVFYFALIPVVNLMPLPAVPVLIVALPVASFAMYRRALTLCPVGSERCGREYYTPENIQGFWRQGFGVVVYSFLLGTRHGFALSSYDPTMDVSCLVIGILFLAATFWWVYGLCRSIDFPRVFQILLIMLATTAVLLVLSPGVSIEVASGCFSAGSSIILVLFFMALVDLGNHSSYHPFAVCGVGLALYGIPRPLGSFVSDYLRGFAPEQYLAVLALLLAYLVIICTAFLLSTRQAGMRPLFYDLSGHASAGEMSSVDVESRCLALGAEFGLSAREIEVVQLICKGRDKAYIADTLFISENTVRSYSKNAYRKLGVHSKRELLDLLEQGAAR